MAEALAIDPRGLKRICTNCGTRFYDMNKRPITCPSCSTEFTGEIKVRTRRSRGAPVDDDTGPTESQVSEIDTDTLEDDDAPIVRDDDDMDDAGADDIVAEEGDDDLGMAEEDLGDIDDLDDDLGDEEISADLDEEEK